MVLTWPQHQKKKYIKKNMYQLGRSICNPWSQCCCDKILLFWWNAYCRITITLKSNFISLFFHFFIFLSFCWVSMFVCVWWKGFYFFFLGIWEYKDKSYTNRVFMFIHVGLIFRVLEKNNNNDKKMKTYERLKPWSLLFGVYISQWLKHIRT